MINTLGSPARDSVSSTSSARFVFSLSHLLCYGVCGSAIQIVDDSKVISSL